MTEQRTFDELIAHFNSTVSKWEIDLKYKFQLLGMIASIGYEHEKMLNNLPSAESEIIRCEDCKHKPHIEGKFESGFDIEFPDDNCPCQCEDGWYNWIPKDDWYCANAERRTDE